MYNTIVVGYSVEGVVLVDRDKYSLFFRIFSSYVEFKYVYVIVFEFF